MFGFLEAVKRDPRTSAIAFVCCRILATVLPAESLERLADVCRYFGAADFIDVPGMEKKHGSTAATTEFKNALLRCLDSNAGV
jgi:hypothetical protein